MNQIKRLPRPLGFTYLSLQLKQEKDPSQQTKRKKEIQRKLIEQVVSNGMMLCNKQITLQELATLTDMNYMELIREINKGAERISNMFESKEGKNNQFARVAFLSLLNEAQELSQSHRNQVSILQASQGLEYAPFLSSALNQALANWNQTLKPRIDLLRFLTGENGNPSAVININNNNNQNTQYITPDMAIKLLQENGHKSLLPDHNQTRYEDKDLDTEWERVEAIEGHLPEVNAKYQDLSKIGIRYDGTQAQKLGNENEA